MNIRNIPYFIGIALFFIACDREPVAPDLREGTTIHYTATATDDVGTRASLNNSNQYVFEEGDRLYVTTAGDEMQGVLTLSSGAGTATATFEGELSCKNEFYPKDETSLSATLISAQDVIHRVNASGVLETRYPAGEYAGNFPNAVRKFSDLKAESTFGASFFSLQQQTSFLICDISFDVHEEPETVTARLANGGSTLRSVDVSPVVEYGIANIQFVLPFPGGEITLSDATISIDDGPAFSIPGSQELAANTYYNIRRGTLPFVILPPLSEYDAGYVCGTAEEPKQAFPVHIAPVENLIDTSLPGISSRNLVITTPEDGDVSISLGENWAVGMDLDPESVLGAILTKEHTTVLKPGNYVFSIDGVASTAAKMTILRSAYSPGGQGWWDSIPGGLREGDYAEVKMSVNRAQSRANLIGFGTDIGSLGGNDWNTVKGFFIFYPENTNNYDMLIDGRQSNGNVFNEFKRAFNYETTYAGQAMVIRFSYDDVYWNDGLLTKDGDTDKLSNRGNFNEKYHAWFGDDNLKIGSYQGANRSKAYYDFIRVVRSPE